jgi:CheY-like chemotaxis protein
MPVLLVEDDPTLLEFLKILLHHSGLRDVESVSRGDAALDAIRSDAFDAIVLDLALPAVSGVEVIRKVRENHSVSTNFSATFSCVWRVNACPWSNAEMRERAKMSSAARHVRPENAFQARTP